MAETHLEWISGDPFAWVSSSDRSTISKMRKLAAARPDEVTIKMEPQQNDGWIYVKIPTDYIKFGLPRRRNLTDEQRQELAARLKANLQKQEV